jgi:integrase
MAAASKELFERGGVWHYRFTNPRTKKQERGSTKVSEKEVAQQILDQAKADSWSRAVDAKILEVESGDKLWIEATTKFIEVKTEQGKRSLADDISKINLMADILDLVPIKDITDDLISRKIKLGLCRSRRNSPATINRYLDLIRSILKSAVIWGWIDRAPLLNKPGASGERQRKTWLTLDQYKRANKEMSSLKAKMMTIALCTGMRIGNIVDLEPSEVDTENRQIFIPKRKFKGKRDHHVPINRTALKILVDEMANNPHPDRVFTHFGKPITRPSLKGWHETFDRLGINDELRAAGLLSSAKNDKGEYKEKFVIHGMRHTFATWLRRTGVPMEIIKVIGGWAVDSKDKTVSGYSHVDTSYLLPFVHNIDLVLVGKKKLENKIEIEEDEFDDD